VEFYFLRGESVGIRCILLNRTPYELESVLILKGSDDYSFIHVEKYGYVTSYAPRTSGGDHHHHLWLRPESEVEVHTPIAIHVQHGFVDVPLELSTQVHKNYAADSADIIILYLII
jgi:hypothetical protein